MQHRTDIQDISRGAKESGPGRVDNVDERDEDDQDAVSKLSCRISVRTMKDHWKKSPHAGPDHGRGSPLLRLWLRDKGSISWFSDFPLPMCGLKRKVTGVVPVLYPGKSEARFVVFVRAFLVAEGRRSSLRLAALYDNFKKLGSSRGVRMLQQTFIHPFERPRVERN